MQGIVEQCTALHVPVVGQQADASDGPDAVVLQLESPQARHVFQTGHPTDLVVGQVQILQSQQYR